MLTNYSREKISFLIICRNMCCSVNIIVRIINYLKKTFVIFYFFLCFHRPLTVTQRPHKSKSLATPPWKVRAPPRGRSAHFGKHWFKVSNYLNLVMFNYFFINKCSIHDHGKTNIKILIFRLKYSEHFFFLSH